MDRRVGLSVIAAAFGLAASASSASAATPSFDCRKASSHNEKLICSNTGLATLDRQIGARYKALLSQLDSTAAQALKSDQRWFLASRDDTDMDPATVKDLTDILRHRLTFLNAIRSTAPEGVAGIWRNITGKIVVHRVASGALTFEANASEPTTGRWVCDTHGKAVAGNQGRWNVRVVDSVDDALTLTRNGPTLIVKEADLSPDYCGMNGGLSGTFFATDD